MEIMRHGWEAIDSCILLDAGKEYVMEKNTEMLIQTVALSSAYVPTGKTIVLYIDNKKYFEVLESSCVPFYRLKSELRLVSGIKYRAVSNNDIYLCGLYYRKY